MFFKWASRENFIYGGGGGNGLNFVPFFFLFQLNTRALYDFSRNKKKNLIARMHSVESFKICALLSV
jgi:hypothetical protein